MLPNILIVLGIIFIGLGAIGLLFLIFQSFFRAFQTVFLHRRNHLYEHDKGRANLEKEYKILKGSFLLFLIIGFLCCVSGSWLKYAPRGKDSLYSKYVSGAGIGNDSIEFQQEQSDKVNTTTNVENDFYKIVIKEKIIYVNGQEIAELEEYLKTLNREYDILLVDDFAVSPTYHKVKELLDAYGMNYIESDE